MAVDLDVDLAVSDPTNLALMIYRAAKYRTGWRPEVFGGPFAFCGLLEKNVSLRRPTKVIEHQEAVARRIVDEAV
jgi:hypothetical protein